MLLEAVLAVGTDLELRATLQHLVDSATELVGARCARGAVRSSSSSTTAMPSCSFDAVISCATAFRSSCALAMA
ncbi:hypothetical protein, partial [Streptomyces sp. NPDC059201]|uniref:hypothetical protein n=1 Tax=Streptomyces sp. NPDC059201 TaxID=3346767 RepID=UPI0036B7280C